MRILKEPKRESYGISYSPRFTEEFKELVEKAIKKIEPFVKKEVSQSIVYFEIKENEVGDYECCDNDKCIKKAKKVIRESYGKGTHIKTHYYLGGGDYDSIETCGICGKPLNASLTWCESELEYLESEKWRAYFLKDEAFLIYCILQNSPTLDHGISEYAKKQDGKILKEALKNREKFFKRIEKLVKAIINIKLT
jgi:hypothetical protein